MDNGMIKRDLPQLPAMTAQRLQEWRTSPAQSYDSLPDAISHAEIFRSESPTLAQIKNRIGMKHALMIVSYAINEVNMMFRADRRMTADEVALTAKRIVNTYWYFKPEDIKKCFNSARPKQFVLEGDSFLSWAAEYDLRRDNACEDVAYNGKVAAERTDTVTYEQYKRGLSEENRARLEEFERRCGRVPTEEQTHQKKMREFVFMTRYRDNIKKGARQEWQK